MTWTTQPRFKTQQGLSGYHQGSGPALVFLHGVGLRSEAWNRLTEKLKDQFSIHALDLPGHGDSNGLSAGAELKDYSNLIIDYIKTIDQPVVLAGHSMGAMIALDIAIRSPEAIKSVAALNAIFRRTSAASFAVKARAAALKSLPQNELNTDVTLARWFGDHPTGKDLAAAQACKRWIHETQISEYQKAYSIFAHHDGPAETDLKSLEIPALFITGADEPNSTPDMSQAMANIVPNGNAIIVEGAAHMMPMTHPDQVALAMKHHFKD